MYFTNSGVSSSYPSMEHRMHMVHGSSPALLLVSVSTTSLQEGHWVMADLWPKLSTCPQERRRLTACSAVIGHFILTLIWVQASLTWSHGRRRYHGTCSGSGLLTQLFFVYLVKLWQQVDPPRGPGTFNSRLTFIRFIRNRCLNNRLNNFLPKYEVFGQRATVTDVGALSPVLVLLRQQLLQLLLNGLQLTQSAGLFTDHWHLTQVKAVQLRYVLGIFLWGILRHQMYFHDISHLFYVLIHTIS